MTKTTIFLCGVPLTYSGLLFKIFVDVAGVQLYYQPFLENLDLLVKYPIVIQGNSVAPPGYLSSYIDHPSLFEDYPSHSSTYSVRDFLPFLRACIDKSTNITVFEISSFEHWLPDLVQYFPTAKIVTFEPELNETAFKLPLDSENVKYILEKDLLENYNQASFKILEFCGLLNNSSQSTNFPSSNWLKLYYLGRGIAVPKLDNIYMKCQNRKILHRLLIQKAALIEASKTESDLDSLKVQALMEQNQLLQQVCDDRLKLITKLTEAAEERLRVIEILDAEVKRLNQEVERLSLQ